MAVSGELVWVVVAKQLSFSLSLLFFFLLFLSPPTIASRPAHLLPSRFRCFFLLLTSSLPLPPLFLPSPTFSPTYPATDPPFPRPPLIFRPSRSSLSPLSLSPSPPPLLLAIPPLPPRSRHPPLLVLAFIPPPSASPALPLSSSPLPTVAHELPAYLISISPPFFSFLRSPPLPFDPHHPASGYPSPHPQQLAPPNQN